MEKVGKFVGHLEYITYSHLVYLWPFGNLVAIWYIFPRFGTLSKENSGNPDSVAKANGEMALSHDLRVDAASILFLCKLC
jgi:hypothetical protein